MKKVVAKGEPRGLVLSLIHSGWYSTARGVNLQGDEEGSGEGRAAWVCGLSD